MATAFIASAAACAQGPGGPPAPADSCVIHSHDGTASGPGVRNTAERRSILVAWDQEPTWLVGPSVASRTGPFAAPHERFLRSTATPGPLWADCTGALHPGWAGRWRVERDGATWRFESKPGTGPLTLGDGWDGVSPSSGVWTGMRSVVIRPGADALTVELGRPWPNGLPFADTRLALAAPALRISTGAKVAEMNIEVGTSLEARSIRLGRGWSDPRDALDAGASMLITRDADVIRYGSGTGLYSSTPMEWDRVYALITPLGHLTDSLRAAASASTSQARFLSAVSGDLSRFLSDGVRSEVRAAGAPGWSRVTCEDGVPRAGARATSITSRAGMDTTLAYLEGDAIAEDLAARLVALSVRGADGIGLEGRRQLGTLPRRARAVSAAELRALAQTGSHTVLVFLPGRPLTPCEVRRTWETILPASSVAVPLLESRPSALIRSQLDVELVLTWDGLIRIQPGPPLP